MVQVSHPGNFFMISKEHSKALARQLNVFVFIAPCIKELSLDVFPWNMSHESQVVSFKSFSLLTLYNEKHCLLGVVTGCLVSERINLEDSSNACLPPLLTTPSPLPVFHFLGLITSHFCNLHVQMLCSHGPVAGLISDPWSGRWLICCWFQLQRIVPPIIFAQAAA